MSGVAPLVVALVLGSALLHATWNVLLRSGADRLWSITVMSLVSGLTAAIAVGFLPVPAMASWPYALGSGLLQVGYCVFLVWAYEKGELGQVYPIARGAAPLLVAVGAAVFAGERLSPVALGGLALVSGGIVGLSMGRQRLHLHATLLALASGGFIAAYMVCDGMGVRLSGHPVAYFAWMSLAQAAPMPFVYFALRRRWPAVGLDREAAKAVGGGLISIVAYGVVVWAMAGAQMAKVSGLRETSILFAAVLAALFLKERFTARRAVCAGLISLGAILLAG
ncbi:MAG TPA: DMT family transporter [Phenylobacterium sp.]|uniref:DMT family transporter n=1 Tax=Phenylobacterium sp. TaxID=1871053 RepID=UPI002B81D97C|nr:DMT family transporter [Phenylobacterium sp.]HXA41236.1 DMT family transporter [Phenylobacterium sp.]